MFNLLLVMLFNHNNNEQARLAKQMPEAYGSVGVVEKSGEEDDEYDVMIRCLWETAVYRFIIRERRERESTEQQQMNSKIEEEPSGEEQDNKVIGGEGASLVESRKEENEEEEERPLEEVQEATEKLKL